MKTLDQIGEELAELYKLPFLKEGALPRTFSPFVTIKRGNRNIISILDLLSTNGGILIHRSTGLSQSTALTVKACNWYVNLHAVIYDEVERNGKVITNNIPSCNVKLLFIGRDYNKDPLLELGIFPLEIIENPKIIGVI